jgi:hypothetical protein
MGDAIIASAEQNNSCPPEALRDAASPRCNVFFVPRKKQNKERANMRTSFLPRLLTLVALLTWSTAVIAQDAEAPATEESAGVVDAPDADLSPAAASTEAPTVPLTEEPTDPVKKLSRRLIIGEYRIRQELASDTELDFVDSPLSDVVDYLHNLHDIKILFDHGALEDAAITVDSPVTCQLKGISLHTGLKAILSELNLTYLIDGELLWITTHEAAAAKPEVRVYDVEGLANDKTIDDLVEVIVETCAPESWSEVGGIGEIQQYQGKLIIRQTGEVQWQIARLLADLRTE